MNIQTLLLLLCAAIGQPAIAEAKESRLAQAASKLNSQSKSSLGVSVRALSLLFQATPGTFLLKDELVRDGSWSYLQELERAGLAKSRVVSQGRESFVQILLTAQGRQVLGALGGP